MEVGSNIVVREMSKPLFTLKFDPGQLSRGLRAELEATGYDIGFEVQYDHIFGVYQFEQDQTNYTLHFKIEELQLRRANNQNSVENLLTILFQEVPQITARGNLLHEVSTGIANIIGRFVTMESVFQLIRGFIPGLFIRGNDLQLVLPSKLYEDWRGLILMLSLRAGVWFRVIPNKGKLELEVYWGSSNLLGRSNSQLP